MDATLAFTWVSQLLAFALFWQSLEFVKLKDQISEKGIWRWSELRNEILFLPSIVVQFLDFVMPDKNFIRLMKARMVAAVLLFLIPQSPILLAFLFATNFLITIRWRGSFNGGSDYMALITLLILLIGSINEKWIAGCLWYLSIQVILSYFLAGIHKAKKAKWQRGEAAADFISAPHYQAPTFLLRALEYTSVSKVFSWSVLVFEIAFPLVLFFPKSFLIAGALFHLSNFVIFGLNRFFWVWMATYPALIFCASSGMITVNVVPLFSSL